MPNTTIYLSLGDFIAFEGLDEEEKKRRKSLAKKVLLKGK